MPTKRKDGRYQSSVILENPITGEKVRHYFYAYTLQELEAERRRIMNANISDFLQVETFHRFADEFLTMKRDVDKLEASTLSTYQGFLNRHILPQIPPTMKISDVKPALLKHVLAQITGDRTRQAIYTLLQSIFRTAKFEQLIENNPMEYIRKPKHKATAAGIVTPEIYHALLDTIRGSQTEHLFKFAWDTGLRRGGSLRCAGRILTKRQRRSVSQRHANVQPRSTRAQPRRHTAPARSHFPPLPYRTSSRGGRRSRRSSCGRVSRSQGTATFSALCATRRSQSH